jgi:hypothetical protein
VTCEEYDPCITDWVPRHGGRAVGGANAIGCERVAEAICAAQEKSTTPQQENSAEQTDSGRDHADRYSRPVERR